MAPDLYIAAIAQEDDGGPMTQGHDARHKREKKGQYKLPLSFPASRLLFGGGFRSLDLCEFCAGTLAQAPLIQLIHNFLSRLHYDLARTLPESSDSVGALGDFVTEPAIALHAIRRICRLDRHDFEILFNNC